MSALLYLVRSEWHLAENTIGASPHGDGEQAYTDTTTVPVEALPKVSISLELSWFAHAPRFEGAVYTYLWRPHTLPPKTIDAQFLVSEDDEGSQNVVINLRGWDHSTGSLDTYKLNRLAGPPGYTRTSSNIDQELQLYLFAAFKQLIVDLDVFVESAYEELAKITYDVRASPGNEKFYYLLHISDCCRRATSELAHASSLLKQPPIQESLGATKDEALKAWFENALKDIDLLIGQLDNIEAQVQTIRLMIKDLLDLRNGRRTALIGLLAVIYIPFAFLSSLFGMNIQDPLWGPIIPGGTLPRTSENLTARANTTKALNDTAQANVTGMALNQTDVLVSAISSSGGYLWSFKIYWIIATPVTFATILLPLIAGPTARYIVKFSYHNRAYSRIGLSLLGIVGEIISAITLPPTVYIIIFGVAYGILAFGMLSWASVPGRSQLAWAAFAMVYAYSIMLDVLVIAFDQIPVTGLVPLLFLILTLFRSEILRLFTPKFPLFAGESLTNFLVSKHRQLGWIIMVSYYILTILLYTFTLYVWPIITVPLGILLVNRLVRTTLNGRNCIHWRIYALLFVISAIADYYTTLTALLPFVPMTYVFAFWTYHEYGSSLANLFRRGRDKIIMRPIGQRRRKRQESVGLLAMGSSSARLPLSNEPGI
ncbi:MAG: hypothetical protein Q9205_005740 [Flavoplaca limonia]